MELDERGERVRAAYNLAADRFDESPLAFWDRAGRRTVDRLQLSPGNRVLDICCGAGSTAIPAAQAVGRFGTVLGVDLSDRLLELAAAKAEAAGLTNVQFRHEDVNRLRFPRESCDAVICQFAIFQLPDMVAGARLMWSLVAPGGALAITTWGPAVHQPVRAAFWEAVRARRPDLVDPNSPATRVGTVSRLRGLLVEAGIPDPSVETERTVLPLGSADEFWATLMGSGNRRVIEALGPDATAVHAELAAYVAREKVSEVETVVLYAVARKPA